MNYSTTLVNAHAPAQAAADLTMLAQTVFYHPDHEYNNTWTGARILTDKRTKVFVTWLPGKYFDGAS